MKGKRTLSLLAAALMMAAGSPVPVIAAETEKPPVLGQYSITKEVLADDSSSARAFDLGNQASVGNYSGTAMLTGKLQLGEAGEFNGLLTGEHSWTVEMEYVPTATDEYNMLFSKGDHATMAREYTDKNGTYIEFSIYENGGSGKDGWKTLHYQLPDVSAHLNTPHEAAFTFDYEGHQLILSLDGKQVSTLALDEGTTIAPSDYPVWIGYCPETNRGNYMQFKSMKIFEGVLTQEQTAKKTVQDSVLWLDASRKEERVVIDTTLLETVYYETAEADLTLFDLADPSAFSEQVSQALEVLEDPDSQETVDNTAKDLNNTWMSLRLKADKTLLEDSAE